MRWTESHGISTFPHAHCYIIVLSEAISIIVLWSGTFVETITKLKKIQERTIK